MFHNSCSLGTEVSSFLCRSDEKGNVTDNAASSLGKVLEFHANLVDASLADTWLRCMPLTHDTVEARIVHEQLMRFVEKSDPR
jgi:hypothetical protein